MSEKPEERPALPLWKHLDNVILRLAWWFTLVSLAQFLWQTNLIAASKRIRNGRHPMLAWFPLIGVRVLGIQVYDCGHSVASVAAMLRDYGIDHVLADLQWGVFQAKYDNDYVHVIGLDAKIFVAGNQFEWADCLLRTAYAQNPDGWNITHRSGGKQVMRKMPQAWGAHPKPRSADGWIFAIIGAAASVGHLGAAVDNEGNIISVQQARQNAASERKQTKTGGKKRKTKKPKKNVVERIWDAL